MKFNEWCEWCKAFVATGKPGQGSVPMTPEESMFFFRLLTAEIRGKPLTLPSSPILDILNNRLGCYTDQVAPTVKAFVITLSKSPADVVMWAHALVWIQSLIGGTVTLYALAEYFPVGFPGRDAMGKLWDAQKDDGANALDRIGFSTDSPGFAPE